MESFWLRCCVDIAWYSWYSLTIGIAVDANVLIYERVREELYKEKTKPSIVDGYQNALSSILDANITTGLTALILHFLEQELKVLLQLC